MWQSSPHQYVNTSYTLASTDQARCKCTMLCYMSDKVNMCNKGLGCGIGPGPLLSHAYLATIETGAVGSYENCLDLWNGTYQLMWTVCSYPPPTLPSWHFLLRLVPTKGLQLGLLPGSAVAA